MISLLKQHFGSNVSISPLDEGLSTDTFVVINLSDSNEELRDISIVDPQICQGYIDSVLQENKGKVTYGGYLERRNLYSDKLNFSDKTTARNIHLGMDFWTAAGTKVITPMKGSVHSFQNNNTIGDYGPTIILKHNLDGFVFHTLYGHLSLASIENIHVGQEFEKGVVLGSLGTPDINVNYAPHLHFQIIIDMEGMKGDYPGVCSEDTLEFYTKNCPDPNIILNL